MHLWACFPYFNCLCHLIHLIIQPNFQPCLEVEEISQEASKSSYKYLTWYCCLTCTDARRDVWEGPIVTEPNKGDMSIERRIVGERPTATENGTYKLAFWYYFLITFFFFWSTSGRYVYSGTWFSNQWWYLQ